MKANPKKLFLIDGIGALVSAFFLGVVLVKLQGYIGMPKNTLYLLAFLPILFCIYDFICYFQHPNKQRFLLKIIAFANLGYCIISIYYLWQHAPLLQTLGWIYFMVEIIILIVLIYAELKIASNRN